MNQDLANIGLDLVRVTEAAALSAARWMGTGKTTQAHNAALDAAVAALNRLPLNGRIVVGEEGRLGIH
ncbi:MAG: fructose-bisphosphatase class II, partial [Chloroflexota bacterium]